MKLKDLLEKRSRTVAAMRSLTDAPTGDGGDLSADQAAKFDNLRGELAAVEKQIERAQIVEDAERRMEGRTIIGSGDSRFDALTDGVSLARAMLAGDAGVDAGREREVSREMETRTGRKAQGIMLPESIFIERRTAMVGSSPSGGFLLQEQNRGDLLIDRLRAASALSALGVTILDGLVGDVQIPKVTGSTTVEWVGENEEPDESDMAFGQIALRSRTIAGQSAYSRQMLLHATPSIEGLLRGDLARQVGTAIDVAAVYGVGVKDPLGLLRRTGLPTVAIATDGGAPTIDLMLDQIGTVDVANALAGNLKWLTNPSYVKKISKLKDGQGKYELLDELPGTLLGYPLVRTTSVPSTLTKGSGTNLSASIFGDWSSMVLGMWSGVDILSNPYSRAGKGHVLVHAFMDVDVNVRHIESFAAIVDAVTT